MNNKSTIELFTEYGYISYYLNDEAFSSSLQRGKIYEQDLILNNLNKIIKNAKVAVDAGAHAGSYVVLMKYINPDIKIYCFEPQKKMFELLQHNVQINKFKDVFSFNNGLANITGIYSMMDECTDGPNARETIDFESYGSDKSFNFGGLQIGEGGEKIELTTIDDLNLPDCDFIKIDTEGAEPLVLSGAKNTIEKFKPYILFEKNYKKLNSTTMKKFNVEKDSFAILNDFGYKKIEQTNINDTYLAFPS